jgi:hypothetical protein
VPNDDYQARERERRRTEEQAASFKKGLDDCAAGPGEQRGIFTETGRHGGNSPDLWPRRRSECIPAGPDAVRCGPEDDGVTQSFWPGSNWKWKRRRKPCARIGRS